MSVKILLDPVLTAQEPSRCSTYIQYYTFVNRALAARDDVFFYWLVPTWVTEEDMKWLPSDPRVHYIRVTQHKDRTKEYVTFRDQMDMNVAFNGSYWDFDILVTVRTPMVPLMKMIMTSPRQKGHQWMKEVWLIEEMPMLNFKQSVAVLNPDVQELMTISGYRAADNVWIMSYHEKPRIIQAAKNYIVPTEVMALNNKIKEVVPAQFEEFRLKNEVEYFVRGEGKPFCISYVGRFAADTNVDVIYKAMSNAWILRGDTVRLLVLTVSTGGVGIPPSHIEMQRAPREEFWRICREDMHLLVNLHDEAGFSLGLVEPMMFGVPALVIKKPWAVGMLGDDYPFYVGSSDQEIYTWMKLFYEDYPGMYAKFLKWHQEYFVPVYTQRFKTDILYDIMLGNVERFNAEALPKFAARMEGRSANEIVVALLEHIGKRDEFVLFEELEAMGKSGALRSLDNKLDPDDRLTRGLVWATAWNDFRSLLKAYHGWEDASVTVGHMKRIKIEKPIAKAPKTVIIKKAKTP